MFGVVLLSQLVGMALALVLAVAPRRADARPARPRLVRASRALLGGIGITALYRGLAVGRMGVVAPITGVLAAIIPVVAGIVLEGLPAPLVLAGIGLAHRRRRARVARRRTRAAAGPGSREALIAGVAIGLFGVAIAQISEGLVFGPLTLIRGVQARSSSGSSSSTPVAAWRLDRRIVPASPRSASWT